MSTHITGWRAFWADTRATFSLRLRWDARTTLHKAYTVLWLTFLSGWLLPWPYEAYTIMRLITCVALYYFFDAARKAPGAQHRNWQILFIGMMLLYNPVFPIHLGDADLWACINLVTILILYRARRILD